MRNRLGLCAALMCVLVVPVPAPAQVRDAAEQGLASGIHIVFVHAAKRELDLSDEQALKLLPLVERMEKQRRESGLARMVLARSLQMLAKEIAPDPAGVAAVIESLDAEEARTRKEELETRDAMLALLEPRQQARFILFIQRFRRQLEKRLQSERRDAMETNRRRQQRRPERRRRDE